MFAQGVCVRKCTRAQNNTCAFSPFNAISAFKQNRSDTENALTENRTRGSAIASRQANRALFDRVLHWCTLDFLPEPLRVSPLQSSAPRIALGGTCHIGLRVGSRERRAENPSEVMTLHVICRGRAPSDWNKGAVSIGWSWIMSNMRVLLKAQALRWAGEKWACDISERKMRKCNKIISHYFRHHPARAVCPNLSSIQSSAYSRILILIPNKHTWALYNYDG